MEGDKMEIKSFSKEDIRKYIKFEKLFGKCPFVEWFMMKLILHFIKGTIEYLKVNKSKIQ
jgi:hypothetical protein